jgi:hypothetical protein
MRRIKLVLAVLAVMVAAFAAVSGPAMADDLNCRDAKGDLIRCDGDLYTPYNADNNYYPYYDNNYYPYDYGMTSNNDYGLFGPCGLFGVYDPYTGACW